MTLYSYRCAKHGELDIRHPMSEVGKSHDCPHCGQSLKRVFKPIHHWWPAQYRPGFEGSGQRMILDPEFQARKRDELAQAKEEHVNRTAKEKAAQ